MFERSVDTILKASLPKLREKLLEALQAVLVLNKQVEEVTDGAISAGTMGAALSAGVAISVGLAMVAMTPLITVQLMGLMAQLKQRKARKAQPACG